ncbi:MAG: hypothetical protein RLW42_06630, partial [Gammaproteobacteria bacterium]
VLSPKRRKLLIEQLERQSQINAELGHRVEFLLEELRKAHAAKDRAYEERSRCVALLASLAIARGWTAGVALTDIEGWHPAWHNCVYIELDQGQVSWHFHERELPLFDHLPPYEGRWDGHDTEEKYARVHQQATSPIVLSPAHYPWSR